MQASKLFLALIALASSSSASSEPGEPATADSIAVEALIESIDDALSRTYVFPEKARVMGDYLAAELKKGAYENVKDPQLLAQQIEHDIQAAHQDGHLSVRYRPELLAQKSAASGQRVAASPAQRLQRAQSDNFSFRKVEILPGNIGYVKFNGFAPLVEEAKRVITAAFQFLANSDAIIIDLRDNRGGSPETVQQICSYFFPTRTRLNDIYDRRKDRTTQGWADPERAGNMKLSMPVYVLTSKQTFSAAEDFSYAMQATQRAITVGEASGGGAHPNAPVDVGQGFTILIPHSRSINYITKTDWEGTGVVPDVAAPAEQALLKAQQLILEKRLAAAASEGEKRELAWLLTALQADAGDRTVPASALADRVGSYGKFKVSLEGSDLRLTGLADISFLSFRLRPISPDLFLADDWLQVEFTAGADDKRTLKLVPRPTATARYDRIIGVERVFEKI